MQNFSNDQGIPSKNDFKALSSFFEGDRANEYLEEREKQLWQELGANAGSRDPALSFDKMPNQQQNFFTRTRENILHRSNADRTYLIQSPSKIKAKLGMIEHQIQKRRVQWACISAESQRTKKTESGIYYECRVFDGLTTVTPKYERDSGFTPPDNTGNHIFKFSKRSRKRLMNRARRLNKSGLPLPYFVTLTYHKNFKDPVIAKKHLNAFFQRWRRKTSDFAYLWKMEPQKRGAVHFHLALFIPEHIQRVLMYRHYNQLTSQKDFEVSFLDAVRVQVQTDWAEVTKEVDGVDVPYTKIDYIRKRKFKPENYRVKGNSRTVNTRCANPRVEYKIDPDFEHLHYGTNVREVDNWRMFMGYIFKYMEKEVQENPFGEPTYQGEIKAGPAGYPRPPYRVPFPVDIQERKIKTGRFWGFSYNLDFEALKIGMVDHCEIENVNDFCNALNALSFARLTEHLVKNAKRKKQELKRKPKALQRYLDKYRNIYESQKKRYLMQRDRINEGYGMQFEINSKIALDCEKYLRSKSVGEFFQFP